MNFSTPARLHPFRSLEHAFTGSSSLIWSAASDELSSQTS